MNIARDNIYFTIYTIMWMRGGKGLDPGNSHTRSTHRFIPHTISFHIFLDTLTTLVVHTSIHFINHSCRHY
jgi:hypothetical protein